MADVTVHVLQAAAGLPAEDMSFLSLTEAKQLLDLPADDTSRDDALKLTIAMMSAVIMRACNRMFARQTVEESWRELGSRRVFLTHWPVKREDIQSVYAGRRELIGEDRNDARIELEEQSGKLSHFGGWSEPVVVTYTGGFLLPTEAPLPLKHATLLLLRAAKQEATREAIEGIRSISHKESRVTFFDPSTIAKSTATTGVLGTGVQAADQLLYHYMRFWV
jgi:hypothetical protein